VKVLAVSSTGMAQCHFYRSRSDSLSGLFQTMAGFDVVMVSSLTIGIAVRCVIVQTPFPSARRHRQLCVCIRGNRTASAGWQTNKVACRAARADLDAT
jgi:hypothetical protein